MLVYDVSNRVTYDNIGLWLKEVRDYADPTIVAMLVGNKKDLLRQVQTEEAADFCKQNYLFYMETSALADTDVATAFETVFKEIYRLICRKENNVAPPITAPATQTAQEQQVSKLLENIVPNQNIVPNNTTPPPASTPVAVEEPVVVEDPIVPNPNPLIS